MAGQYSTSELRIQWLEMMMTRLLAEIDQLKGQVVSLRQRPGGSSSTPFNGSIDLIHGVVSTSASAASSGGQMSNDGVMRLWKADDMSGKLVDAGSGNDLPFFHKSTTAGVASGKKIICLPDVGGRTVIWEEC